MNGTRTVLAAVVFSLVLVLNTLPAEAVSYINRFCVSRINTVGTSFVNMTTSSTTFCYLSNVGFEETDGAGERAMCEVFRGSSTWSLRAVLLKSDDADATCCAECFFR